MIEAWWLGFDYEAARWEVLEHRDPAGLTPTAQSFVDDARRRQRAGDLGDWCGFFALNCALVRRILAGAPKTF